MISPKKPTRVLRVPETCHRLGISRSTLLRLVAAEKIKKIKLGGRAIGFLESDVEAYISGLAA